MTTERHEFGATMFKGMGDVAPAMGMIGTLIGLVAMLSNMDDPKAIGVPCGSTAYDTLRSLFCQRIFACQLPLNSITVWKKKAQSAVSLDGIVGIADGQNPRVIEGILKNYLAASKRAIPMMLRRNHWLKNKNVPNAHRRGCPLDGHLRRFNVVANVLLCTAISFLGNGRTQVQTNRWFNEVCLWGTKTKLK